MAFEYTPAASSSLYPAFAGRTVEDGGDFSAYEQAVFCAKYFGVEVQSELLKHQELLSGGAVSLGVRNATGGTLVAGTLVYISGYDAAEEKYLITAADADAQDKVAQLVLLEDLTTATNGVAYGFGTITGLDTSAASAVGAPAYLSGTAGEWTLSAPASPANKQRIGTVTVKHATNGAIYFFPAANIQERMGAGNPFADDGALVKGATSATKQMRIDVETLVTAGQTRVLKMPDANVDLPAFTAAGSAMATAATVAAQRELLGRYDNAIINGCFRVAQRGTAFDSGTTPANNDDTYLLDRWVLLSDGNNIVSVAKDLTVKPTGEIASCKMTVATADKKFGKLQILEASNARKFIGGKCSLSFDVRTSAHARIDSIKAVILSWSSTADAVTSDVVNAWNAEGAEPTWANYWTREGDIKTQVLSASDTWYTVKLENVDIDYNPAVTENIAVFIWCDVTDNDVGDILYLSKVKLNYGSVATEFEARDIGTETFLCKRYYEFVGDGANGDPYLRGYSSSRMTWWLPWSVEKRIRPTACGIIGTWATTDDQPTVLGYSKYGIVIQVWPSDGDTYTFPDTAGDGYYGECEL